MRLFSEALLEVDRNTVQYMIDVLQEENAAVKACLINRLPSICLTLFIIIFRI